MSTAMIYTIHYLLHGEPKTFVVRTEVMNNAEAMAFGRPLTPTLPTWGG